MLHRAGRLHCCQFLFRRLCISGTKNIAARNCYIDGFIYRNLLVSHCCIKRIEPSQTMPSPATSDFADATCGTLESLGRLYVLHFSSASPYPNIPFVAYPPCHPPHPHHAIFTSTLCSSHPLPTTPRYPACLSEVCYSTVARGRRVVAGVRRVGTSGKC